MNISIENISKSFGTQKAIDSVSFSARQGEIVGFLGPNGAGKTTIMKIITCFLNPDRGDVKVGNLSINHDAEEIKQYIGYLPEHNPLYDDMNIIDFLHFVASIHNVPKYCIKTRTIDMLRICGLEHEKHKLIRELSKGYKQRVGLAQALIHDPEIIILDEPTTGLDPNQIMDIRHVIKNFGKTKTIIVSSHILAEIEAICDKVLIINKGKIVADGTTDELRHSDKSKTLRIIITDEFERRNTETIYEKLLAISCIEKIKQTNDESLDIQAPLNTNIEQQIFEMCTENNWYISMMTPVETSLEDIFRQVTQN